MVHPPYNCYSNSDREIISAQYFFKNNGKEINKYLNFREFLSKSHKEEEIHTRTN